MDLPTWFPDELAHAGNEHLDADYVLGYDRKAGSDPAEDVALLRTLGLNETSTLLDLGAGTGTFTLAVAPFCRRVIAVDVSRAMLTHLEEKAAELGIGNVVCVQAGFLSYEHRGGPVEFVYSRNALHHLPDFWKALALVRIAMILTPGGVLRLRDLLFSFGPREAAAILEAWFARAPTQSELGWTRAELEKDVREEHVTFSWLLEPILARAGFTIREVHHEASRVFSAYTCVKAR
jgi:ubiquinone/menaquinone biosynthesis C-methylase UbiE